jgi:uncharacterized membrane protein
MRFSSSGIFALIACTAMVYGCADTTTPSSNGSDAGSTDLAVGRSETVVSAENFSSINFPGATATLAFAINDAGTVVGRYVSAGRTHGFVRNAEGELSTLDYPGASFTVAGAINNNGDIAGWYSLPTSPTIRHGFVLRDGEFVSFDPPGSTFTNALGINDRGDVTGRYCTKTACREPGRGDFHGFLLRDGEITTIDVGSIETNAWKTNNRGEIAGGYGIAEGGVQLFVMRGDAVTTFALPNGKPLSEDNGGINARGDIVGKYCDVSPCLIGPGGHGFVYSSGVVTTIDFPGSTGTAAYGINARRQVVGGYFDAQGALHGYLLSLSPR